MRVAICDDSNEFIQKLEGLCKDYFAGRSMAYTVDTFTSGPDLLKHGSENFDLIFLDMRMPGMSGIEAAKQLRQTNTRVKVICVSSYLEYAVDGYQVQAAAYLLKDQLAETFTVCMQSVVDELIQNTRLMEFKFVEGLVTICLDDVLYVESRGNRINFHLDENNKNEPETYHQYGKLDDLEAKLGSLGFLRINQSYLVNTRKVAKIRCYAAELSNGKSLPIPKNRYAQVKQGYALAKGRF